MTGVALETNISTAIGRAGGPRVLRPYRTLRKQGTMGSIATALGLRTANG